MRGLTMLLLLLIVPLSAQAEEIERLWEQLPTQEVEQISEEAGISFRELARAILSGEAQTLSEWPEKLWQAARQTVGRYWVQCAGILACACICRFVRAFAGDRRQVHGVVELLCRVTAAVTLLAITTEVIEEVAAVCGRLRGFTDAASPLLVAAMTLSGAPTMATAIPPSAVAADGLAVFVSANVGIPLLRISALLAAFGGMGSRFRLERLFKLSIGAVKWMLGCCMTGFLALMSVRSIAMGGRDGATVQTVRFAVDNLLPIIGGELADTVGSVFASAALVKNAAGIAVCGVLVAMVIVPLVRVAAVVLMLKVASACLDMLPSDRLPGMLDRFAQTIEALMAILAAVAALGMILAGAVVFTAGAGK